MKTYYLAGKTGMLGRVIHKYLTMRGYKEEYTFPDFVINAAGVIPQRAGPEATLEDYSPNWKIPIGLRENFPDAYHIQVSTNCVYELANAKPPFIVSKANFQKDVYYDARTNCYAYSKLIGEQFADLVIRCSFIGFEPLSKFPKQLLSKFLEGEIYKGYLDVLGTFTTTLEVAKHIHEVMLSEALPSKKYIINLDGFTCSKAELLNIISEVYEVPCAMSVLRPEGPQDFRTETNYPLSSSNFRQSLQELAFFHELTDL